jgi:serine/threonine protein kinase
MFFLLHSIASSLIFSQVKSKIETAINHRQQGAPASAALPPPPDPDDGSGIIVTEVNIDPAAAMKAIEEAFPSSSRVGPEDFEPLKVLGDGCFGKVMLVRRKGTDNIFAMKSIHKDHVIKNKKVRHTKTERNVMTQLRHPFIMQLHFAFQSGGKLYLVMDYFSGGDMFFHLSRERRFSVPVLRFMRSQIFCLALNFSAARSFLCRRNCSGNRSASR